MFRSVLSTSCLAVLLSVSSPTLLGQAGLGSITGEILDPTGARLPNASIRLLETSTQIATTTVSNSEGIFTFPSVVVGSYTLSIKSPGFKDKQLGNLAINAFQQLSLGQISLEVGQGPAETVTVTAEQELVKDSAVRSETVQARQVSDMPLQGRNWVTLLKVVPGVNATSVSAFSGREYTSTGYADFRINGKNANQTQVNLDGGSIVDQGSDAKTTVAPSLESIEEISILANNYQAEYGYRAGAVINVVTKSGTNQFRGTLFDDLRNDALNANSWQNNYAGLPRQRYRYNYIGGNISGPVKKNKLFFFYNYENFLQDTPQPTSFSRTPTALERQGDFSQTFNTDGSKPVIYMPGTQFSGSPVPVPNNILPADIVNPLGKAIMNLFPEPNNPNDRNNNFALQYQTKQPRFSHTAKVDWNILDNTRAYVRFTDDGGTQQDRSLGATSGNLIAATIKRPRPDRALAGNFSRTFSPTLVMNALFGWSFDRVDWIPVDPEALTRSKNGLGNLPTAFKPANDYLPAISVGTYPNFNFNRIPAYSYTNEYQASANFTWSRNRHIIKFGFMHIRNYKNEIDSGNDKGTYVFTPGSSPFDTNYAPANVLVGAVSSFTQTRDVMHKNALYTDVHFFVQDTWKIKPNLTFDYGVRVYHMPTQHQLDAADTLDAAFLPSRWDAAKAPRIYVPSPTNTSLIIDPANPANPLPASLANVLRYTVVPGSGDLLNGIVALGSPGVGNPGILDPRFLLFAPRAGFAWSPLGSNRTVVRGGFGWGYNRVNIAQAMNAFENGLSPQANLVQTSFDTLSSPSSVSPISIRSFGARDEASRAVSTVYDYSVSVQRELPFSMVLDAAYVGNFQRHQPIQFNLNAIPLGAAFLPQFVDPRSTGYNFFGPISSSNPGTALPGSNTVDNSVMRPYRGFDALTMNANVANVRYNSMQLALQKRFGHGLTFQAAYTLGRTKGQIESFGLFSHDWKDYTGYVLNNDRLHVFTLNYTYEIPRLSRLVRMDNGFGHRVFDGWRLAHLATFFSGASYTPTASLQQANSTSTVDLNKVFLGTPDLGPRFSINGDPNSGPYYFDATKLALTGIYPASDGKGVRNFLHGVGSFANDISIVKSIQIAEQHAIELRASFYNAFNSPRRVNVNSSITYKANGKTLSDGFSVFNTPEQLAARNTTGNSLSVFNSYRSGVGYINLTDVQPMRVIEIGLKFRF